MSRFEEYLLVIGCFQGSVLFALLFFDARMSVASRVLGLMCLLMASVCLMPFLLTADSVLVQQLAGWVFYLPAAGGSLAYLYCRSALLDRSLAWRDTLLFLPWIGCYLLTADVIAGDPQHMVRWIGGHAPRTWRLQASEYLEFAQAFAFAGVTIAMIGRYRLRAGKNLADYDPAIFRWLLMLQTFTLVIWMFNALPSLTPAPRIFAQTANLLMVVLIYLIALTQWRDPDFFRINHRAAEQLSATPALVAEPGDAGAGELDEPSRARLFEAVREIVEERKLYLDSGLTLARLADETGFSRHQVSEALNQHAGKNFYEFINGYRVTAVCDRLDRGDDDTVLDIAFDAGFSSKSTFNAIFKQFTGLTPTAYRRRAQSGLS